MTPAELLNSRLGIEAHYASQTDEQREVPKTTVRALWAVLGPEDSDPSDPAAMLAALDRREAATPVDPVIVISARSRTTQLAIRPIPDAILLQWEVIEEQGERHRGEAQFADLPVISRTEPGAHHHVLRQLILPRLPLGYHRLELRWTGRREGSAGAALIMVPQRAYLPSCIQGSRRAWGVAAQLYSLRSPGNWGIGDFSDLAALIDHAAQTGADSVGLNPLHALFPDEPSKASPYSPSSRLFLNTNYIDVTAISDFAECELARALVDSGDFQDSLARAREAALVDYPAVVQLKQPAFEFLYASFRDRHLALPDDARAVDFRAFQKAGGSALRRFATFQALREHLAADLPDRSWRHWPAGYRDPDSMAIDAFVQESLPRIEFFEYLQWQASLQLGADNARTQDAGMGIGLYGDLAVGFDPNGADAWAEQDSTVEGWSIGAPPDAWNLRGQNWGIPPLNPQRLREQAYRPFIEMLRANMRHAGALRIDHALGLKRLFWIPAGQPATAGAYVHYPLDEMLGLVALESVRNRCLVIGEDLGTVPAGFSEALQDRGILSYRLLYFERKRKGAFRRPVEWPRNALAAISTHDLPTLTGYWTCRDIDLKERLSLYPDPEVADRDREARRQARRQLAEALAAEGLPVEEDAPPIEQVHRFIGRTRCRVALTQMEDLIGVADQVNLPGTLDEHPNWRRKLPQSTDEIFADPEVGQRLVGLDEERRRPKSAGAPGQGLRVPRATYRLQLNRNFTFDDAAAVLPYLHDLGISHVYASPILQAQPGSTHGYDVISFERLNPELGGEDGFERFDAARRSLGLGLIVDFVPNHMGIGKSGNAWWLDLLEFGQASAHAMTFDIDWAPPWPELRGQILVPFLGDSYGAALEQGELVLRFDSAAGSFDVWYYDDRFPIHPSDYGEIIEAGLSASPDVAWPAPALSELAQRFRALPSTSGRHRDVATVVERARDLKAGLAQLAAAEPAAAEMLSRAASTYLPQPGDTAGVQRLDRLLEGESYRPAGWRSAAARVNYRRFFDVSQLAAICMERPAVFDRCHRLIGQLIAEGRVDGLRLDHIDGLADPAAYLHRLRRLVDRQVAAGEERRPLYLLVEKILAEHENLRRDWPVDGTTGYEFTNLVNGLFVDPEGEQGFDRIYGEFIGEKLDFDQLLRDAKRQIIEELFPGDLTRLAVGLARIAVRHWRSREFNSDRMRKALREIVVHFPVYRTYVTQQAVTAEDRREIEHAVIQAKRRDHADEAEVYDFLHRLLTGELPAENPAYGRAETADLVLRVQQFTAPITAKSLEDTAFYRYVRLVSLNEVGGDPRVFGISIADFHRRMADRRRRWPHSLLATATHDTKRGEDVRVRIDALSEIPETWGERLARWSSINSFAHQTLADGDAPSRNDEYLIYQTLLGAWPIEATELGSTNTETIRAFADRVKQYLVKALREAKQRTSWLRPNAAYEDACLAFVDQVLDNSGHNPFLEDFATLQPRIARLGALNGLSQTVLKLTVPGVPDIYQGCELWDFNLVDPDNRRPVAFDRRRQLLQELAANAKHPNTERGAPLTQLCAHWHDGRIKLHVIAQILAARQRLPDLFADGSYEPLRVTGPAARHVVAFARRCHGDTMIVAVGRLFAELAEAAGELCPKPEAWRDTVLTGPSRSASFTDILSGETVEPKPGGAFDVEKLFRQLPVAVLITAAPPEGTGPTSDLLPWN